MSKKWQEMTNLNFTLISIDNRFAIKFALIAALFYVWPNLVALVYPAQHVKVEFLNCTASYTYPCEVEGLLKHNWLWLDDWTLTEPNGHTYLLDDKAQGVTWRIHNLEVN